MRSGIGGLLAQSGANIGSQVGGAYGQLGSDIGGMLSGIGAKRQQKKQTREVQELLAKYQNNPAQLNAVSAKYASEGNDALAKVFAQAAQRSVDAQAKKTQQAGQAGLVGLGQVLKGASPEERQAILRDASGSLTSQGITAEQIQGVAKETQEKGTRQRLEQNVMAKIQRTVKDEEQKRSLMERYKGASEEDLRSYLSGAGVTGKDRYSVVGNRVFDNLTGSFIADPGKAAETLSVNDLSKVATPASIVKYVKSQDPKDLVPLEEENGKVPLSVANTIYATDSTLNTIDKALGMEGEYWQVPYVIAKEVPLTASKELAGYVTTIQATLAFDRLQRMRDESKTGGALGQVSNIELDLLKSSVAALDPSSRNFMEQLGVVRSQYETFKNALLGNPPADPEKYVVDGGMLYYFNENDEPVLLGKI
jgi:hypothetical protein